MQSELLGFCENPVCECELHERFAARDRETPAEGAERASFTDEMRAEYALAGRVVRTHDFREGVRALLIDKTGDPQWDPATPEEVTEEMLDVLFAPLPPSEQWTPFPEAETVE